MYKIDSWLDYGFNAVKVMVFRPLQNIFRQIGTGKKEKVI